MMQSVPGVPHDLLQAMLRLQKSIDGGEPIAMVTFAVMIDKGLPMRDFTSRTSIDLLTGALKSGEMGARAVAVEATFNQLKPETRRALQRQLASAGAYSGSVDAKLSPSFVSALVAYARTLEKTP